jgi:hypothetical protein
MTVSQTTRFGVYRWSDDADAFTRSQLDISHENIENKGAIFTSGTTLPTPAAEHERSFFLKTDTNVLYYFQGSGPSGQWVSVGQFGTSGQMATLTYGQANSAGSINAAARIDHVHALPTVDTANLLSRTLVDAKGDLLVGTSNDAVGRLAVGADGSVLTADSTQTSGLRWNAVDLSALISRATIDARGDLLIGTANDTVARQPLGTDRRMLLVDPSTSTGVSWQQYPLLRKYTEEGRTHGSVTSASFSVGDEYNVEIFTLGANVTLNLLYPTYPTSGGIPPAVVVTEIFTLTLIVSNDATAGRVLTFPSSVKWPNGVRPNEDTAANKTNIWTLTTYDKGIVWYGFLSGRGFS